MLCMDRVSTVPDMQSSSLWKFMSIYQKREKNSRVLLLSFFVLLLFSQYSTSLWWWINYSTIKQKAVFLNCVHSSLPSSSHVSLTHFRRKVGELRIQVSKSSFSTRWIFLCFIFLQKDETEAEQFSSDGFCESRQKEVVPILVNTRGGGEWE